MSESLGAKKSATTSVHFDHSRTRQQWDAGIKAYVISVQYLLRLVFHSTIIKKKLDTPTAHENVHSHKKATLFDYCPRWASILVVRNYCLVSQVRKRGSILWPLQEVESSPSWFLTKT